MRTFLFLPAGRWRRRSHSRSRPRQPARSLREVHPPRRFGSALGEHVVRGTTTYALGELFKEDLRYVHCPAGSCTTSKFKLALQNTFTAAKGSDGHRERSVARFIGPISGGLAARTWRPEGLRRIQIVPEIGFTYALDFVRNLVRELVRL
jgi:hypothetical protein